MKAQGRGKRRGRRLRWRDEFDGVQAEEYYSMDSAPFLAIVNRGVVQGGSVQWGKDVRARLYYSRNADEKGNKGIKVEGEARGWPWWDKANRVYWSDKEVLEGVSLLRILSLPSCHE